MFNLGVPELLLILVICLLLFGAGRLPEIARSLGKSIREFKRAMTPPPDPDPMDRPTGPTSGGRSGGGVKDDEHDSSPKDEGSKSA